MDYLKVWTSFREVISPLNDAEKGRLFDAMLLYAETGEEPRDFRGNERILWPAAKQDIDRMTQRSETNKANGSKTKQNEANESEVERTEAAPSIKKRNIKKDIEKENILTDVKEKRFTPPSVEEVSAYCLERGNSVDAQTFVDFYTTKGWRVGKDPMKDWKACVRTWERNRGYTKPVPAQQYSQRGYDDEDMEARRRMLEGLA